MSSIESQGQQSSNTWSIIEVSRVMQACGAKRNQSASGSAVRIAQRLRLDLTNYLGWVCLGVSDWDDRLVVECGGHVGSYLG